MLAVLYIIGIFLGLFSEKSKIVRMYQFVVVWIVFVFNTRNADMETYKLIYQGYYGNSYELGFDLWKNFFAVRQMPFEMFWLISMSFVVLVVFWSSRKLFNEIHNGAVSLMMIFPLLNMVITLRNTMANVIVLIVLVWYLKCDTCKIINKIKYMVFVFIAASFHYAAIFFLVMLIIKEELPSRKNLNRAFVIMIVTTIGLNTPLFMYVLKSIFHTDKVLDWFSSSHRIGLGVILVWGIHIMQFAIVTYSNRCHLNRSYDVDRMKLSTEKKIYSLNVFSTFLLGFYTFNMEFFTRIYATVIMINLVNNFHLAHTYRRNKYATYGCIMQIVYILFIFVVLYNNVFSTISDIFINNSLFK